MFVDSVTTCEISYPCLIHSACDEHCATYSGCDNEGEGHCDTECVDGYKLDSYECIGEYVYVTVFLINVVPQKCLILMCSKFTNVYYFCL